ncbi:cofactor assembly of complex C subunit B [Cyanobium sp. BSA11S]|uniref:cofactor assembly of complex C subunit B n=1 Tax=Synechococcales TaxID=1890424 RepID=UPI00351C0EDB
MAREGPPETGIRVSVHANVVDTVTTMPTPARFTLAAGLLGLGLCLLNQLTAPELNPALERAGVLASLMAVGLMLVAVLWTRALPIAPERVELEGEQGLELAAELPEELSLELAWGSRLLLTATPAASLLIHWQGRTLLRRGLLGHTPFDPGEICGRATANGRAVSLVNLKLYPGREEFSCLPVGTPAVLVQPIGSQGWLLAGGWSPRCFSRSDELWIEGWAEKLRTSLERADVALSRGEALSAPKTPAPPGS